MAASEKCHVCGDCWWVKCDLPADYRVDVALKRNGLPLYDGEVDLCSGHYRKMCDSGGRLDLSWEAIEQALAFQNARPKSESPTLRTL